MVLIDQQQASAYHRMLPTSQMTHHPGKGNIEPANSGAFDWPSGEGCRVKGKLKTTWA